MREPNATIGARLALNQVVHRAMQKSGFAHKSTLPITAKQQYKPIAVFYAESDCS